MKKIASAVYKNGVIYPKEPIDDIKENEDVEILYEVIDINQDNYSQMKVINWDKIEKTLNPVWDEMEKLPELNLSNLIREERDSRY